MPVRRRSRQRQDQKVGKQCASHHNKLRPEDNEATQLYWLWNVCFEANDAATSPQAHSLESHKIDSFSSADGVMGPCRRGARLARLRGHHAASEQPRAPFFKCTPMNGATGVCCLVEPHRKKKIRHRTRRKTAIPTAGDARPILQTFRRPAKFLSTTWAPTDRQRAQAFQASGCGMPEKLVASAHGPV